MLNNFFNLSLTRKAALITTVLAILACTIVVLASYHGSKQLIHNSVTESGQSLIQQLVREASNPLVQDDKLSLQALLNDLVNSPMVVHAVIYDVQSRPIVEAGQPHNGLSLSASVTFQDSIAGLAVITLNSQSLYQQATSLAWQLIALTALIGILVYFLSSWPARYISALLNDLSVAAARPSGKERLRIAYRGKDELRNLAQQILRSPAQALIPDASEQAVLYIEINNPETLQSPDTEQPATISQATPAQLTPSHSARPYSTTSSSPTETTLPATQLLITCYKQLTVICKLYEGHLSISGPHQFTARFYRADTENSYAFRALCAGLLVRLWISNHQPAVPVNIGLALKEPSANRDPDNELAAQQAIAQAKQASTTSKAAVVATQSLVSHRDVSQRILTQPSIAGADNTLHIVQRLTEPYQSLLTRQLDTLCVRFQDQ